MRADQNGRTSVGVDLLEAGQARIGLQRHSQFFRAFVTD
jgi:hypothetical protein